MSGFRKFLSMYDASNAETREFLSELYEEIPSLFGAAKYPEEKKSGIEFAVDFAENIDPKYNRIMESPEVLDAISKGERIKAIKALRQKYYSNNFGLREAKNLILDFIEDHPLMFNVKEVTLGSILEAAMKNFMPTA